MTDFHLIKQEEIGAVEWCGNHVTCSVVLQSISIGNFDAKFQNEKKLTKGKHN